MGISMLKLSKEVIDRTSLLIFYRLNKNNLLVFIVNSVPVKGNFNFSKLHRQWGTAVGKEYIYTYIENPFNKTDFYILCVIGN